MQRDTDQVPAKLQRGLAVGCCRWTPLSFAALPPGERRSRPGRAPQLSTVSANAAALASDAAPAKDPE